MKNYPEEAKKNPGPAVEISIPNRMGYEKIAMACAASYAKILGLRDDRIEDLKTAVAEACINAIEHGNSGRGNAEVVVLMTAGDDRLVVWVADEGKGLSAIPPDPSIEKKLDNQEPPRGFGLFLMRNLADEVSFDRIKDTGHAVRMTFKRAT
jgi:serine/threonine-protein kinase RsbW